MNIVIVEPHPDDAFISLGGHIEELWKDHSITIVTVFADVRRSKEARDYAATVGAYPIVVGLAESKMLSNPSTGIRPIESLRTVIQDLSYDMILFPLGLQHPDHLRVAASRTPQAYRYLDTPYQSKQKLGTVLRSKVYRREVHSILYPNARKWRHQSIFRSQAKFFHFNPLKGMQIPEIILGALRS